MSKHRAVAALSVLLSALTGAAVGAPARASVVTTTHTGSGAPALAHAGGRLYVAWTGSRGTAAAKEVVVGRSADNGQTITKLSTAERTLQGEGPAGNLVVDSRFAVARHAAGR
ncbi:hypothetical protein [Dactylosporangium matsuzakiense]|uniref:Glycosyl hydrolase family 43 n=1 Tax=Dactylosporangium matsuzakiense TaxID=53360 RepID=A0A9W6KUV6_9ACTN|nr:hypothetical protein [Dactylosporangium matsuzakiense]UWZ41172.1 hypothetical protein Dmats_26060 [Dactylosporangium matsuzakiense]GLL08507.1 hypothetical protein GCM10017581_102740 [Dactylosporangium matsuzakiense]